MFGTAFAFSRGMIATVRNLMHLLEAKFGVHPEFTGHLVPILEQLIEQEPDAKELKQALEAIAAAYGASHRADLESLDEVRLLLGQFSSELRKLDETLKVLGVYVERVRQTICAPAQPRVLH